MMQHQERKKNDTHFIVCGTNTGYCTYLLQYKAYILSISFFTGIQIDLTYSHVKAIYNTLLPFRIDLNDYRVAHYTSTYGKYNLWVKVNMLPMPCIYTQILINLKERPSATIYCKAAHHF